MRESSVSALPSPVLSVNRDLDPLVGARTSPGSADDTFDNLCGGGAMSNISTMKPYVSVSTVESEPLRLGGEACLEFWYLLPEGANGSALRALLKTRTGPVEIWTSPALQSGSWRQVFVPLAGTEAETRVSLEAVQELSVQGRVAFDRIGVRKGQCANSSRMTGHGTCTVHTDPQCSTFDGALFRFMAPCTYVLAQTCAPTQDLPMFSVEVVSGRKGNSSVSAIQQVNVELKGLRVSLLKRQTHRAIVNGIWRKLPMVLDNGTVEIHSNPAAVMIETDFGLFVSYDNTGAVQVTVPASYDGKVCGMCGNFNHRGDDDYLWPDGLNATALAPSQQTEATSSCEITLVPHKCDPGEMSEYSGEPYCGGLISGTGPFSGCLAVVGAESYFRSCVSRMCGAHGNMAALCETLQAYADICQEAGVDLPAWRNSTLCPLVCGENSHYSACAEACPEVCAGQDLPRTCGSCEERCECDSGFKLSGGRCVLTEDCGCWKNGQHYKRGAMFLDGECNQQCRCMGNNEVHCTAWHCADNEVCMVEEGVKGCFPSNPATCRVYGDPHYITLDGKAYDFQGGCNYTLATACGDHSSVQFTVTGRNHNPFSQNLTRSKLEAVGFQVEDVHIILNQSGTINHLQVSLPYSTNGIYGSILVYRKNQYIVLETSFGLRLTIDGWNRLFLQVDERHKGGLCGLCGTYSDDQSDDFTKPDGKQAGGAFEFGNSWRVMEDSTLCNSHPDDPRSCDADEKDLAYSNCSALLADAFTPCHDPINPDIYMTSCVYDYCATGGDRHTFCSSLESYAVACKVAEVALPNWQEDTVCACPLSCNFDNDLCGWQQLIQDTFDWRRQSGPTPSNRTGPNQDHTTGASFYMYIEGDSVTYGDSARMLSPKCHYSGPLCLSFWYHMYGSAKAMALNIYKLQDNKVTKLWWDANDQGQQWHLAFVDIKARRPFQIIAEGIRGSNTLSDVAIDDISMHFGSCSDRSGGVMPSPPNPESNMTAPPRPPVITTAIPQPPVVTVTAEAAFTTQLPLDNTAAPPLVEATTDSIVEGKVTPPYTPDDRSLSSTDPNPVCKMNCDFDQDLCAWNQLLTDVFDWTRNNGSTPTELTGPSSDHTNGNGHYLYIEANSATHGDTARLLSAECSDSGPQCLQFWYHMYGSADTMGLHVYLLQDSLVNAVWRSRNDQGNMWHLAQVDLTTTGPFQIIFEGRRGSNDQSDVAIDDVSLHRGRCADLIKPTTSAPPTNGPPTTENPELLPLDHSRQLLRHHNQQHQLDHNQQLQLDHNPQLQLDHNLQLQVDHNRQRLPGTQSTVRPQPTTEQPDIPTTERKQPPATEKPGFPSTKRPGTPSTAGPQPPTTPISTPSCPENSHYTACVPACQPTCEHLHGPSDCTGNEPCTQGCVCDDGFVLKMRVCVPIQQCGCVDRNGNKHTFNEVWYTNHCSQKCKCEEDDGMGKIDCDDKDECDGGTACLQDEMGHYHCSSMGFSQCTIRGEPEYRTFDDMKHKFEGEHSYVLVQTTGLPNNLPEVYIEGINAHTPDNRRGDDSHDENSSEEHDSHRDRDDDEDDDEDSNERKDRHRLRQLKIRVYNHTVEFRKNRKLVVDGRRSHGSVSPSGGLKIRERSSRIYLKTDFGLSVEFDGSSRAEIILPHTYKRKVGGLCGNFDGRKKNDLMKPDGSQANSVAEFGESWRVTEDSLNINWSSCNDSPCGLQLGSKWRPDLLVHREPNPVFSPIICHNHFYSTYVPYLRLSHRHTGCDYTRHSDSYPAPAHLHDIHFISLVHTNYLHPSRIQFRNTHLHVTFTAPR
ncbi:zonadhesin-like [Lampris incognitus]|uniref:zonadhesin-like n=1 Tax=Lampris incognitus TaxID=2546036 RepID=UPI0024B56895|nr:zonadhesin-like [Lampris incognitus]